MAQVDITGDYRSDANQSKFPRLKLQMNEKARVVIVSKPEREYVHRLEAPNIVNMAPTYKKVTNREKQEIHVVDTRFISGPICLGSDEKLRERGFDPDCPACEMSRERPDIFRPPQAKYAVGILRYGLRPGGGWNDIAAPYGVSALVWVFSHKIMDKLIDIRSMGAAYEDLRAVDLLLECDDTNFQKPYSNGEFLPVAPAVWLASEATRKYTVEYLAANGPSREDLIAALGKKPKPDWLADDISRVIQRWDVVRAYEARRDGQPSMGPAGFGAETLGQGMSQLQQQYAPSPGNSPAGFQPQPPSPPQGYQSQPGGGLDMSLLGGGFRSPVAGAYEQATGQQLPPGTGEWKPPADLNLPPTHATEPAPSTAPAIPEPPATAASPPVGLDGLKEFMASHTSNPLMEAQPSVPHEQMSPPPAAPAPAAPERKASYTFEELARMGQQ